MAPWPQDPDHGVRLRVRTRRGQRAAIARWPAKSRLALVASLRAGPSNLTRPSLASLVAGCDPGQLSDLAIAEGLAGPAYVKLGVLLPPGPSARLATEARQDAARHVAYLGLLRKFAAALDQAKVTWVALKGPVLAEVSYQGVSRGYSDLDLMVHPRQLRAAVGALESAGAILAEPAWPPIVNGAKGQLTMAVHGLPMVDLHWHLVYLRSARERWAIPTEDLLQRRQRARLQDVEAWSLDRHDFVAHLALHASFGAAQQLRRLLDIERTVANSPPDWAVLVERCRAWRVGLPVSVMLNRARQSLGAAVPPEVIAELAGGRPSRLLVRRLGDWNPAGRMPGGRSLQNGLTRSLRDGLAATAGAFAAETWHATDHLRHLTGRTGEPARGDRAEGSEGRAEGSEGRAEASEGFERYLAMVGRTDRYGHLKPAERRSSQRRPRDLRGTRQWPPDSR